MGQMEVNWLKESCSHESGFLSVAWEMLALATNAPRIKECQIEQPLPPVQPRTVRISFYSCTRSTQVSRTFHLIYTPL